jgi:hypothetical protein
MSHKPWNHYGISTVHETAKAVLLKFKDLDGEEHWIAKSQTDGEYPPPGQPGVIGLTDWMVRKIGLPE